ncbi:cytochrome-c oxidase, cbb3-type subunit III [Thiorhodococcus mannitoliphagus]|uniref:Cbb3-type cytochrome c oxidase subunit n=1 Tax=Thiorhodococcus mannitoliphagus TaxID=329406 RepID=A0A6P1DZ98_9GAMM|nr:cytochrome-c oxidase, cbb3-type subunit III [Thiorhodococcus mannitoliphagus]NEX22066.1 cytochrome-c oxidase, cbb3-type subunit III [Thiorhodococcus mannitoliphagus]
MAEHNPFPGENNTGHVWDDNLRELKNPPPRWWMLGFWASLLWVVGYSLLYPTWPVGQEPTQGLLGWSQMKEYEAGMAQVEAKRAKFEDQIKGMSADEILADPGLKQYTLASAKVLFGDNCSACHGSGGQGNPGYPVLADDDWLYGGKTAKITESITIGRQGAMTPHKDILTAAEIDTLAKWVVQMAETNGAGGSEEGWNLFKTKGCTACHGQSGNGILVELPNGDIVTVGAANLTDGIWRFKPGGYESAKHTITYGVNQATVPESRNAVMPAFGATGQLSDQEIKKLVVYVHQLGGGQ